MSDSPELLKPNAEVADSELQTELGNLQAEKEEIAEIKKQLKEAAAELHREERSIELEKLRWQRELSDSRAELADAKATILKQGDKIRELERGYSFKPNPAESALRREIGELREQLETERADREEIEAQLSDLKQKSATASELPEAADLLNQLKARRKKSKTDLADLEAILEILES